LRRPESFISGYEEIMGNEETPAEPEIMEPTFWKKNGWSARVIKNEDDDGWAVEISKAGVAEPVLVSPWVMGRDKKNPKPFDSAAFRTFVKTASEVLDRSTQQREGALKKRMDIAWEGRWYEVTLAVEPDEFDPHAVLSARDDSGTEVATWRVAADFKLTRDRINAWARDGFPQP
jgi:hypothetical protein